MTLNFRKWPLPHLPAGRAVSRVLQQRVPVPGRKRFRRQIRVALAASFSELASPDPKSITGTGS